MQDRIVGFVAEHSRMSEARIRELMLNTEEMATDMGSVLDGRKAVEEGLIDCIGGLCDALEYLRGRIGGNGGKGGDGGKDRNKRIKNEKRS